VGNSRIKTIPICHPERRCVNRVLRLCSGCYFKQKYGGEYQRAAVRRSRYKITDTEFYQQRRDQQNRCAICRVEFSENRNPCVDHDHETDVRRGLLCDLCNKGLGQFKDNPALLTAAARYLESYHEQTKAVKVEARPSCA
jgi:hypothetical protein